MGQGEKQRNPVCRRKSSKCKPKQECRSPLLGRPAKPALLCASAQRKTAGQTEKQTSLFFRLARGFSYVRKLAWRHASYRRKLFVIASKPVRRLASLQLSSPGRKRVSSPPNFCSLPLRQCAQPFSSSACRDSQKQFFTGQQTAEYAFVDVLLR